MEDKKKKNAGYVFSNDAEENFRIENEVMKIKMQAERAAFFAENMSEVPPELEAQFLKNVAAFEIAYENARLLSIYECIGAPRYKKLNEITNEKIEVELRRLMELLSEKNIILEVLGQYELSVIYRFITEELFFEKVHEINLPGYQQHFVYEEFHPDHYMDIERVAEQFFEHWFEKEFFEPSFEFAQTLVAADGKTYRRAEVIARLNLCQDNYKKFRNIMFKGPHINFNWDEGENRGLGHAEGMFSYEAIIENGEIVPIEGPFKLYMANEYGVWKIFYFLFPGFKW